MPKGSLTEEGPRPEFAELYNAYELDSPEYPDRTRANVAVADATLWFGDSNTHGALATFAAAQGRRQPTKIVSLNGRQRPSEVVAWLREHQVKVLNVAGHREGKQPGIGARVEGFMFRVFALAQQGAA